MKLKGARRIRGLGRTLRKRMTPPEIRLWQQLRKSPGGFTFRRQHEAGDYVLDFYCAPARLAIEVDGEIHSRGDQPEKDAARDAWLAAEGVQVIRVPAKELLHHLEEVIAHIVALASSR
ncbi:hypothetical protein DMC47_22025 [Nostoc sp. 3335mG]|jgi:very-short-patch-repair endonuclease|nr:hypothetical protein DMC47_22025 [Nostoc sp. 3335mG]